MQFSMITLAGFAVLTFIGVQIYERVIVPRNEKRRGRAGKT